jgi:polyisoprenoid-binding protein YceI
MFLAVSGVLAAQSYTVRPADGTRFALTVEKTGLMRGKKHLFLFERYQGALTFDPRKPEESQIQLTIDSRSAAAKDDWVSAKDLLKIQEAALEDMLAVRQFPNMTFVSGPIKPAGPGRYEAQGMLTIRNMPMPVTVRVQLDARDPAVLRLLGTAKIHLRDYGLKPPSALLGAIGTKEEMSLEFEIVAVPEG